jgi:hypothetical protein
MMPSSYAFSPKALPILQRIPVAMTENEDKIWRRQLAGDDQIRTRVRDRSRMAYHLHGKNLSTWDSLGKIV